MEANRPVPYVNAAAEYNAVLFRNQPMNLYQVLGFGFQISVFGFYCVIKIKRFIIQASVNESL